MREAVERFDGNEERIDVFVNAPKGEESYQTRHGEKVETLPHFMRRITDETNGVVAEARKEVYRAEEQADRAETEADRAENAASQIPGFAENAYAVFGLKYSDTEPFVLEAYRSEPAEDVYVDDYESVSVLPASCLLSVEDNRVKLHIPFTS